MLLPWLVVVAMATGAIDAETEKVQAIPSSGTSAQVRIRVAYYLNDVERDARKECRFALLVDDEVVDPVSSDGRTFTYRPQNGTKRILVRCGREFQFGKPAYECLGNDCDATIVISAYTELQLLSEEALETITGASFDDHYPVLVGHLEGRTALRKVWQALPGVAREEARAAGVLYETPGTGVAVATTWIR